MKNAVIALVLISIGLADLFLDFSGLIWLDLGLIASGLLAIGFMVFTSIIKVIIFAILLFAVTVASLIGLKVITIEDITIFVNQTKTTYTEEEGK